MTNFYLDLNKKVKKTKMLSGAFAQIKILSNAFKYGINSNENINWISHIVKKNMTQYDIITKFTDSSSVIFYFPKKII